MNESYETILQKREDFLQKLIKEKSTAIKEAPSGSLNISRCGRSIQYYNNRGDGSRPAYISVNDTGRIRELAQKDYDYSVLKKAEQELASIRRAMKKYPDISPENVYEKLSDDRKALVTPITLTDEEYKAKWMAEQFSGSSYKPEHLTFRTMNGEMVRSKSESIIADHLFSKGIPYRYEAPLTLSGFSTIYPDFTVLNVKRRHVLYHEHFGMMDNGSYASSAANRINMYQCNGIYPGVSLVMTMESGTDHLDIDLLDKLIERFYLN